VAFRAILGIKFSLNATAPSTIAAMSYEKVTVGKFSNFAVTVNTLFGCALAGFSVKFD
jgi:hypothetical protein